MMMKNRTESSIVVKDLKVGYDANIIIPSLNIEIPKGKVTMIIGSNGCGKSTFLKTIARILKPQKGEILISGTSIKSQAPREIAKKMAVLPQSPTAPSGLLVKELVSYGRFPYLSPMGGLKEHDIKVVEWAMKATGVYELRERPMEALSGGQRQRVWIAMALAQETEILVLDEPTTYLDMAHQLEILQLLKNLNQQHHTTIVMVLHELNNACKFADHIIGMKKGKVVFEGKPMDVITEENLQELYGIKASLTSSKDQSYPICMDFELLEGNNHE